MKILKIGTSAIRTNVAKNWHLYTLFSLGAPKQFVMVYIPFPYPPDIFLVIGIWKVLEYLAMLSIIETST